MQKNKDKLEKKIFDKSSPINEYQFFYKTINVLKTKRSTVETADRNRLLAI